MCIKQSKVEVVFQYDRRDPVNFATISMENLRTFMENLTDFSVCVWLIKIKPQLKT